MAATTLLQQFARHLGDERLALVDPSRDVALRYADLGELVPALAAQLRECGAERGATVVVLAGLSADAIVLTLATWWTGATLAFLNPLSPESEIRDHLRRLRPALVLAEARDGVDLTSDAPTFTWDRDAAPLKALRGRLPAAPAPIPAAAEPDDIALLVGTSGTTGTPKFVKLTHGNLASSFAQVNEVRPFERDDHVLSSLPIYHVAGMNLIVAQTMAAGARLILQPRFDPAGFLDLIAAHAVTRTNLVPTMVRMVAEAQQREPRDVSSLRFVSSGAAPLQAKDAQLFADVMGLPILQGYGLSETSSLTHHSVETAAPFVAGFVGHPLPGTEQRIVDPDTAATLPPGGEGELWVRGPQVSHGYLDDDAATASTFTADGWMRTGDIGTLSSDGGLTIVDRLKDILKYKGHQIAPVELESLVALHADVVDAAVVGVPDDEAGEIPVAFVVVTDGFAAGELAAFVKARVAPHKQIRDVVVVDAIPRSPSGKILRRQLRDDYATRARRKA